MIDERIVPSFHLSEFLQSETAARKGLDNTPMTADLANIRNFLAPGMQAVRELLGRPVTITSGYRAPAVNQAVGGARNSQHMVGLAADFICPGFGAPLQIARALVASHITFDQVIQEGSWVHISFSAKPRRVVLTASFTPTGVVYRDGLV